jgi:FAD/FMN-containing dehydrogenase
MFMDRIGLAEATRIVDTLQASDAMFKVAQLRVLGGAYARVPVEATAYGHRKAPIMVNLAAFYTTPEDKLKREAWVDQFMADLTQETKGAYVNFLSAEGDNRVRGAYPGAIWDRLRQIKRQYDPRNLFRLNQNIAPAEA